MLFYKNLRAFTLIELLIVIGIVAILGTAVVTVINPVEIIEQTRDTQRLTELKSIDSAISLGKSLNSNLDVSVATSTVYISLPDANSNCSSYATLPSLPGGWSYNCVTDANLRKVDGTGWIPLNFSSVVTGSPFASLPIDPKNTADGGLYYTYVKGSWELTSCFESNKYVSIYADNDGCQKITSVSETAGVSITPSEVFTRRHPSVPPPSLPDGSSWALATDSGGSSWTGRRFHTSITFNNKMWILGGMGGVSEVWSSSDGISWTEVTLSAGWGTRYAHASVVFNNKMWVMGGYDNYNFLNDVWSSTDGINWTQETAVADWSGRQRFAVTVFNNKIWVIGGQTAGGNANDVWSSTDGINWTEKTAAADWNAREGHTSVVFNNKIWVLGGSLQNDVWSSTDGINWTEETAAADWSGRHYHTSVVFDNKMWVIGGRQGSYDYTSDAWYSSDGISWTDATSGGAEWDARQGHSSVVFDNKIWVMAGYNGSDSLNDVWYTN